MMHATPSMLVGVPTMTQERELAAAITLAVADAMIAARTEARALAYRVLRPSAVTSSTLLSRQGIDHLPIS